MSGTTAGQIVGGVVGAVVGFFVGGGPTGAVQGFAIGWSLGGVIDPPAGPNIEGPRLEDKRVIVSTYGQPIPLVYGPKNRLSGNVIWSTGLLETENEEESGGKGGGGGSTTTTFSYRLSCAVSIAASGKRINRIWGNNKLIYDATSAGLPAADPTNGLTVTKASGTHTVFDELHFYTGSDTQVPDPVIESYKGAGNTPAYRHNCYVVLKDLQLADFGNRLPNLEFEFAADESISLGQVLHDITDRVNVQNASVTGLHQLLDGYIIGRASNASGAIAPLALAYNFDMAEQRGQVRFIPRARAMKAVIPRSDMGGRSGNDAPIEPIRHGINSVLSLPKEVTVSFSDEEFDYQTNSQRATKAQGTAENIETFEFPLTLTVDQGRQIADRLLWAPWSARKTAKFRVSDKWVRRDPGDVLGIEVAGGVIPYKMIRAARGDNGVIDYEVQQDDPSSYDSPATGSNAILPSNPVKFPGSTRLLMLDMPIVRDIDDNTGFYWAVTTDSDGWRGSRFMRSSDGGITYSTVSDVFLKTRIGDVAAAVPTGPTDFWDRGNSITVVLHDPAHSLESKDETLVLNGGNSFWLGNANGKNGEIIQFATATLTAPKTYVLTDLLRGRLGTEANVGTHGTDEVFVLLNSNTMGRSDFGPGDWAIERNYKGVSILTDQADASAQQFTNDGVGKTPLSPVQVMGVRDSSNDLTVTFKRRTRLRVPGLGKGPAPLGEATEAYEIDIYKGASIVRTIAATTPTFVYTAAQQTTDTITPGSAVTMRIYQMSDVRGRGFPAIATV